MPQITGILLVLKTGTIEGASSDGDAYLGLCGREFWIDSKNEDLNAGQSHTYKFGDANDGTSPAEFNDPREQMLMTENFDRFPAYIRFVPRDRGDNWQLQSALVYINNSRFASYGTPYVPDVRGKGIVMGIRCGQVTHLQRLGLETIVQMTAHL
jgi:hypothetical protein